MPAGRPTIDLDEFKDLIREAWQTGLPIAAIHSLLNDELAVQGQQCGFRTLERRLAQWQFENRHSRIPITEDLINRVRDLFFKYGYSDSSILRDLRQEGIILGPGSLKAVRHQHGMKRRFRTAEEREAALQHAFQFLEDDLQKRAAVKKFGRGYIYHYVRMRAGVLVSKNRLYDFYRQQLPQEVRRRFEGNWRHRRAFSVPGPNFMWSLDGYDKLKNFGFQVY